MVGTSPKSCDENAGYERTTKNAARTAPRRLKLATVGNAAAMHGSFGDVPAVAPEGSDFT